MNQKRLDLLLEFEFFHQLDIAGGLAVLSFVVLPDTQTLKHSGWYIVELFELYPRGHSDHPWPRFGKTAVPVVLLDLQPHGWSPWPVLCDICQPPESENADLVDQINLVLHQDHDQVLALRTEPISPPCNVLKGRSVCC